jgi:hypothetical protein
VVIHDWILRRGLNYDNYTRTYSIKQYPHGDIHIILKNGFVLYDKIEKTLEEATLGAVKWIENQKKPTLKRAVKKHNVKKEKEE